MDLGRVLLLNMQGTLIKITMEHGQTRYDHWLSFLGATLSLSVKDVCMWAGH